MRRAGFSALLVILASALAAGGVRLTLAGPAVVWNRDIMITGTVVDFQAITGTLYVQGLPTPFAIASHTSGGTFSVPVRLSEGTTAIVARVDSGSVPVYSDTLQLTLGYNLRPECFAYATVSGNDVTLRASILENPDSSSLAFSWTPRPTNPSAVTLSSPADSVASFSLETMAPHGEYYFDVAVHSTGGDTVMASTFVTLDSTGITPFNIRTDHACWIDSATVYGITPTVFVESGHFFHITQKLPELADLGVTTLWIQPIFRTRNRGQGYDVIDYFSIRGDVGNESTLRTLVQTAHALGIRVLLDFVPNHSSSYHPYAQDAIAKGEQSYYYDFYQRDVNDGVRYSGDYVSRTEGAMQFVHYRFWGADLVNLNYNNPDVQRWIIEASRYWIETLDIDGYRIDAVWGVTARTPEFTRQWRLALKRIKPEILLLAEDKATLESVFDERFDAAYDWAPDEGWVSHWRWQPTYSASSNPTIFNTPNLSQRSALLRAALTGYPPNARVLRFMENNDTFRFLPTHDLARTKMVGSMLFSLPGIPLLFNGQEIGATEHPYSTSWIFQDGRSIRSMDQHGLFAFYRNAIAMRKRFPALMGDNFAEVPAVPGAAAFAFRRWEGRQNIFTVMNMAPSAATVRLDLPQEQLPLDSLRTYYLTDYFTGQTFAGTRETLDTLTVPMDAFSTRVLVLDTIAITGVGPAPQAALPAQLGLAQNFPNPFNPSTSIRFELPEAGRTSIKVYDLLGREVAVLLDGEMRAGSHAVVFDAGRLATGVYLYRLETGSRSLVRKMVLIR